jgi:SanA protein
MVQHALQNGDPIPEDDCDSPISFNEIVRREWRWADEFVRKWLVRLMRLAMFLIPGAVACYAFVGALAEKQVHDSVNDLPVKYVGLVLGCPEKVGTGDNAFFVARVEAAKALLEAGKVQFLLVSGDPDRDGCNEPLAMKTALVARGVPADKVYCDFGGGRTLDSVVRARKVFGQRDMTIVSHGPHNERALYIARRRGLPDSVALNSSTENLAPEWRFRSYLKEAVARVLMLIEIEAENKQPDYPGEKVNIGPHWPPPQYSATIGEPQ